MKKNSLLWLGLVACILLLSITGCAHTPLQKQLEVATKECSTEDGDQVVATAARVKGGPMEPSALALQIHLKQKVPQIAYQKSTVTLNAAQQPAAQTPPSKMPKDLKSAKLRWVPPKETPRAPTSPPQVVVTETGYFNRITRLTGATNVVEGWLVKWGGAFLSNAPVAAGIATQGYAYPATKITQSVIGNATGGNAGGGQGGQGGIGYGGAGGNAQQQQQQTQQQQMQQNQQMQQQQ